jgi:hypothetical protein
MLGLLAVCGGPRAAAAEAGAEASCGQRRPWVRFERTSGDRAPGFQEIVRHVRAELELRSIDVCLVGGKRAPIASVRITAQSPDAVEVTVNVRDAVTQKQVSRVLDLRALPADARPLAIAVGTDELLRASWVEIAIAPKQKSRPAPPPEVDAVVEYDLSPTPHAELAALAVFESYAGGQEFVGIDVRGGFRLLAPLLLGARLGMRQSVATRAPNGTIRATALVAGAGASIEITPPRATFGAALFTRCDVVRVSFVSEPDPGASAHPGQGTALTLAGGAGVWLALNPSLRLSAEGSLGGAVRPVRASDTGTEATAVAGAAFALGAGLAFVF